jgi:23S rRNA (adenine-N6)-dimethyltransferase
MKMLKPNSFRERDLVRSTVATCSITESDIVYVVEPENELVTTELSVVAKEVILLIRQSKQAELLRSRLASLKNIEVREVDFLHYVIPDEQYKVFSNVISVVTSRMIKTLLYARTPPLETFLVMQEDAAKRYSGMPKETEDALLVKPWFQASIVSRFQRSDFVPVPSMDIVLLNFKTRENPLVPPQEAKVYRQFVSFSFDAGKKGLDVGYEDVFTEDQWSDISQDVHARLSVKPAELTFDQWLQIFEHFKALVPDSKRKPLLRK